MRAERGENGRCELPLLHTAGGLVGGDQLSINLTLKRDSRCLITSVAAQKVYGSVARSKLNPPRPSAHQTVEANPDAGRDLRWPPTGLLTYRAAPL